jgi:anti-anti-sigma factor
VLNTSLTVRTTGDGTVVVHPAGDVGVDEAVEPRRALVHLVRRVRPRRLVIDLTEVSRLDSINVGTLTAIFSVADDCGVAVFADNPSPAVAAALRAAGVSGQRLRPMPT